MALNTQVYAKWIHVHVFSCDSLCIKKKRYGTSTDRPGKTTSRGIYISKIALEVICRIGISHVVNNYEPQYLAPTKFSTTHTTKEKKNRSNKKTKQNKKRPTQFHSVGYFSKAISGATLSDSLNVAWKHLSVAAPPQPWPARSKSVRLFLSVAFPRIPCLSACQHLCCLLTKLRMLLLPSKSFQKPEKKKKKKQKKEKCICFHAGVTWC